MTDKIIPFPKPEELEYIGTFKFKVSPQGDVMNAEDYAVGSAVLPASSVGAPHRRERLWFVGNANSIEWRLPEWEEVPKAVGASEDVANAKSKQCDERQGRNSSSECGEKGLQGQIRASNGNMWSTGVWIDCPDGKQRLIEPTIPLLAHGYSERVSVSHSIGDGIVPQLAAEFIMASM